MIEMKDASEWKPKSVTYDEYIKDTTLPLGCKILSVKKHDPEGDYLSTRRMIADNFETWTIKQKLAIVNALFDQGMASNNGDGGVIA